MSIAVNGASRSAGRRLNPQDLSIRTKIMAVGAVTLLGAGSAAWLGLTELGVSADNTQEVYSQEVVPIDDLGELRAAVLLVRSQLLVAALATDPAEHAAALERMVEAEGVVEDYEASYAPLASDPAVFGEFSEAWDEYLEVTEAQVLPLVEAGKIEEYLALRKEVVDPIVARINEALEAESQAQADEAEHIAAEAEASYVSARSMIIAFLIAAVGVSAAIALYVSRQVRRSVTSVAAVASALSHGDLTVRANVTARDELGRMAADLDSAADALHASIGSVTESAVTMASAAEELSATTLQISAAARESSTKATVMAATTEEVGQSVTNVASATEQMSASIREIAENAARAANTANAASAETVQIQETVAKLGESSQEVGKVIALINAIAEQTNLLALNATIEAARAGEAGRGFAVVANEVKELAGQTAQATSEISDRVQAIQADTSRAVSAIQAISGTVASISELQTAIAGAVEEQTATTVEISRSVGEAADGASGLGAGVQGIAEAAESTSAGVSQSQAAIGQLAQLAADLREMTATFTV